MNPRARLHLVHSASEEPQVNIAWLDFHPGDVAEHAITTAVLQSPDEDFSLVRVEEGQVIYIRWWAALSHGVSISMDAILDDFYRIGLDTYNWSRYVSAYHEAEPHRAEEIDMLLAEDHDDTKIEKIPKEIHRDWFDIALKGGIVSIERGTWDYDYNVANFFGFFPWVIFFGTQGKVTDSHFEFEVAISSDFNLNEDEIFDHIDGELDEQFWTLIYQFVLHLDRIEAVHRDDTWYRFLQAVHEFTTESANYLKKLEHMFNYRDLLPIFSSDFISQYVQRLLQNIADQEATAEICQTLLEFSSFLLEFELTDLAKLTEATALEHTLQLADQSSKHEFILELTRRSAVWGDDHLISFIQSLIGLLPRDEASSQILSDSINEVAAQLRHSWDGMLCIVEGKLIANRIGDAIQARFEATDQIGDRLTKSEDIFSSLVWSLQYVFPAEERQEIALPYLESALEHLPGQSVIDQVDVVIQTCLNSRRLDYLRIFLSYIRQHLGEVPLEYHDRLLIRIEELLSLSPSSPRVSIEFLILQLYALQFKESLQDPDQPYQLVSQVYNSINPSFTTSATDLQYITEEIIRYALLVSQWSIVEEARRRYLLLASDTEQATRHLKAIFFKNSIYRAKLSAEELSKGDMGIRLFNEALELSDMADDYNLIIKILPSIKRLAIKSRSYSALTNLILTDVKIKRLKEDSWLETLVDDIRIIINRGNPLDVAMIFSELLSMDLNEEERLRLLKIQLELSEAEPDLLTADEVYEKRQQLAELAGDDTLQAEFMIENFQRGISELISKGDTANLTNLLLDAISYSQTHHTGSLEEFKMILLDNFDNITQDIRTESSHNLYLYLLTVWRRIIETFLTSDFEIILSTALRLLRLNIYLYDRSENNQYLRRAQLILKELALAADEQSIVVNEVQLQQITEPLHTVLDLLTNDQEDFGQFSAVYQAAMFYHRIGHGQAFLPLLDHSISKIKQQILSDSAAHSSLYLLLLLLAELNLVIDGDFHEVLQQELLDRITRILNFARSLDLERSMMKRIRQLEKSVRQSPTSFFHEFPFTLGQYLNPLA